MPASAIQHKSAVITHISLPPGPPSPLPPYPSRSSQSTRLGSLHYTAASYQPSILHMIVYGEGNDTPLRYSCLENPMDGGAWSAAVHGVVKSQTQLSNFTFTFHFHALEKEMATHSSVLAWRIPGTVEPGGLPSMGSHRVGHDWSDLAAAAAVYVYQYYFLDSTYPLLPLLCPQVHSLRLYLLCK